MKTHLFSAVIGFLAVQSLYGELRVTDYRQLGTRNASLLIDSPIVLEGDITVDSTSVLRFTNGGKIKTKDHTLVINGGLEAGFFQIFECSFNGRVRGNPKTPSVLPQWFKHNGSTWAGSFQLAVDLIPEIGGTLYIPAGKYVLDTTVFIPYKPTPGFERNPDEDPNFTRKRVSLSGETIKGDRQADSSYKSVIKIGGANGTKDFPAFRINSRDDTHTSLGIHPGNQYNFFFIRNIFIQNSNWRLNGTGIYLLNFADCTFENIYLDHLKYGINTAKISGNYNERVVLKSVLFRNIMETCFHGGDFNDALLIENCYILNDESETTLSCKAKTGFFLQEGHGINIVGGIYNSCETAFNFRYCAGINISGIYSEGITKQIFYVFQSSSINVQGCFLDVGSHPDQKVMRVEGDKCRNVQFFGNRILVPKNNGDRRIFSQNDTGTYKAFLGQVTFVGNQIGWKKGPALSDIEEYELPHQDRPWCRIYTSLSGGIQVTSLEAKEGIKFGFTEDTASGTVRWNPAAKKLQVFTDGRWIDLH